MIAGVSAGKVIIDCATLSPERMQLESDKIIAKYGITTAFYISIIHLSICTQTQFFVMKWHSFFSNFRGGKFLEAPVSGSKVPADMAQLIFLCAGDEEVGIEWNEIIELGLYLVFTETKSCSSF